jgi:hypothetical protein
MEEALYKHCLTLKTGSDKRLKMCYRADYKLTTKVSAQKSSIYNLTGVVEALFKRLIALEGRPASAIDISLPDRSYSCPAPNCAKVFNRIDHLYRYI